MTARVWKQKFEPLKDKLLAHNLREQSIQPSLKIEDTHVVYGSVSIFIEFLLTIIYKDDFILNSYLLTVCLQNEAVLQLLLSACFIFTCDL